MRAIRSETRNKLAGMQSEIELQRMEKTLRDWITGAQKRMANPQLAASLAIAEGTLGQLEPTVQMRWTNHLSGLKRAAERTVRDRSTTPPTESTGDPVAMVRLTRSIRPELQQLRTLANASRNSPEDAGFATAVTNIENVFSAYAQAVEPPHPSLIMPDPVYETSQPTGRTREGQLLQTGLAIAGAAGVIGTSLLAFFAKDEEANWTLPLAYGVATAAIMGYDRLTQSGADRIGTQLDFLRGTAFRDLRNRYNIRGPDWMAFVRDYYEARRDNNQLLLAYMNGSNHLNPTHRNRDEQQLKDQHAAILGFAPSRIQPRIQEMLDTDGGLGTDFRNFANELNHATMPFAQRAVLGHIQGPPGPGGAPVPRPGVTVV